MSARNVTVVAGVSGTGKSAFGRRLMLNDKKLSVRFMFDADFSERDPSKTEFVDWLGLPPCRDGEDMIRAISTGWVAFDPHHRFEGKLEQACAEFCQFVYDIAPMIPGEKVIVIPEVWRYCRPQGIPQALANIVQSGRRPRLRLIVDTQEPNKLNSSIINGMSELVCFKLQGDLALKEVCPHGFDAEELKALPNFHFIGRNLDTGGELRGRIKI